MGRRRRAELWALYFLMVAIVELPSFMADWRGELGDHLGAEPGDELDGRLLHLVKGGEGEPSALGSRSAR